MPLSNCSAATPGLANAQTTSAGEFTFQDLPLGKYSLTVSQAGFQTEEIKDINVEAGKIFNLQARLSVAAQATSVEVSAASVAIETSSSVLTSVIPTKVILDVPLNGRDFTELLKLNLGVNANGSVNGTRVNGVNWQIDGADNNDQWHNSAAVNQGGVSGIAGTLLPFDAIDEFSLQTNNNAEQGRNSGGTLNLVIKSGNKRVIRGGYGIYYQVPNVNYFGDNRPPNHGALVHPRQSRGCGPGLHSRESDSSADSTRSARFRKRGFPYRPLRRLLPQPHFITGYSQNSNVNIQYQLSQSSVLEVGYTGSLSRHLPVTLDINQLPLGEGPHPYAAQFPNLARSMRCNRLATATTTD